MLNPLICFLKTRYSALIHSLYWKISQPTMWLQENVNIVNTIKWYEIKLFQIIFEKSSEQFTLVGDLLSNRWANGQTSSNITRQFILLCQSGTFKNTHFTNIYWTDFLSIFFFYKKTVGWEKLAIRCWWNRRIGIQF
jgi:hypothetical protein